MLIDLTANELPLGNLCDRWDARQTIQIGACKIDWHEPEAGMSDARTERAALPLGTSE